MALVSSKFPGSKEITKVGVVSILVCAIVFGVSWMQWTQAPTYYIMTSIYAVAIALVAPLVSLYLDRKNPLVSDRVKAINIKKVAAIAVAVSVTAVFAIVATIASWMPSYYVSDVLALAIIIIAPLVSLYFDYYKNLAASSQGKNPNLKLVALAAALCVTVIMTTYTSAPGALFNIMIVSLPLAVVFIAPLISLYFDYKNPLIGVKNRKPSRTKAIITIAVGFMLILTIIASTFTRLLFDTTL